MESRYKMYFPILNIFTRSGDIRCRSSKSTKIGPNFACFGPLKFFWGGPLKILDQDYKNKHTSKHDAKFHSDWPMELRDLAKKKKRKNKRQQNLSSLRKLSLPGGLIIIYKA